MKKVKLFRAYAGKEDEKGNVTWTKIALFTNKEDAEKAAEGKYQGQSRKNGKVEPCSINYYESYEDYTETIKAALRKSALAKLTKEEREALGYGDENEKE